MSKLYKGKPSKFKGIKLSEEHKIKLKNNHWSRHGYIHPFKGKHHTEETKNRLREYFKDKPLSTEHKEKIKYNHASKKDGYISPRKGHKLRKDWVENIKKNSYFQRGEKHPNWKGWATPLYILIRTSRENKEWRKEVFKRDNYTCQECFSRNGNGKAIKFEAHHKKRFSLILKEFLNLYSQFSPIEDKETLLRLSFSYEQFWDISNGITLCEDCHNKTKWLIKKESPAL